MPVLTTVLVIVGGFASLVGIFAYLHMKCPMKRFGICKPCDSCNENCQGRLTSCHKCNREINCGHFADPFLNDEYYVL